MRITWTRISLISLLAIALSFVLSFGILCSNYSLDTLLTKRSKNIEYARQSMEIAEDRLCLISLQQQKYIEALANCRQSVEDDANNLEAHLNLGLAYYYLADYQQAIEQNRFIVRQNPYDYRAFYNWGLANSARGEYQQAIEQYHAALSFVSENSLEQALILNDLGAAWIMLKDYDRAISNLDRAIELDSSSLASYFNRGCAHHRQGSYQQGIDDFTQVVTLDAQHTEAYISRAILYHLVRQEKAAYNDLDIALQQYREQDNLAVYQKIIDLKNSMIASKVQQTA